MFLEPLPARVAAFLFAGRVDGRYLGMENDLKCVGKEGGLEWVGGKGCFFS
jgi:hypothetical protein